MSATWFHHHHHHPQVDDQVSLFSSRACLATYWYCVEKLDLDQTSYRTLAGCRLFHPVQAECFQGTAVCLSCSIRTSTPRSDEASGSHAIGLDQTCQSNTSRWSHKCTTPLLCSKEWLHIVTRRAVFPCIFGLDQCRELTVALVTPLVWIKGAKFKTVVRLTIRIWWQARDCLLQLYRLRFS